jgi:hypothetical protein
MTDVTSMAAPVAKNLAHFFPDRDFPDCDFPEGCDMEAGAGWVAVLGSA